MVVAIVILSALVAGLIVSVWLIARDLKALHKEHRSLADAQMAAGGMSAGGMIAMGGNITHT